MALPHKSIATISSPEFINLQPLDINPLMSSCEIKVLYVGENRNRSYISKEVASEMAKTLRGAPIVGYYKENKQDFADHGQQMIWDDEGIRFNCLTKPYGFVSPDAKVWFQKFNDFDDFGNSIEREYLMTTGYLWAGQFEEAKSVITEGKAQSMELDENNLQGYWATNVKNNIEFFIINDAVFTKLCILGDETEPCFEGASITAPDISSTFSKSVDDNFKRTLFSMINDLRDALKGGENMGQEEVNLETQETEFELETVEESTEEVVETSTSEAVEESTLETSELNEENETFEMNQGDAAEVETDASVNEEPTFEKKEEEEPEEAEEVSEEENKEQEEDKDKDDKYSLLEQQYNELSTQYSALKEEYNKLLTFKNNVELKQKEALIEEFYMLSEDDKKDVIAHINEYSLNEIKAKLAVICFEKKVNFNSDNSEKNNNNIEQEIITYDYNDDSEKNLPDWVKAVKNIQNSI